MKWITAVATMVLVFALPLRAQDSTARAKLDTLLIYQRALLEAQQRVYEEVHYVEPLAGKKAGIELNVARILVSTTGDFTTIPGTVSLFAVDRSAELAFPFFLQTGKTTTEDFNISGPSTKREVPMTLLNLDVAYRRFLGSHQDGFYFSGGVRYTHIEGIEGTDFLFGLGGMGTGPTITVDKAGVYFGIGYRYFTRSGFYWGTGIIYGRYLSNDERDVREVMFDDSKIIMDFELLKFGIAF